MIKKTIYLDDAIDALDCINGVEEVLRSLPSAQPEIIRCKDCKHWKPQVKGVNGDGLGCCNFHKANFVTGEGFCYWAERREE
jgi:hypothetical protein